jgi:2-(1,2-epoxy-1,2-dihydrophenyl)acetyl-CoA isomerase
MEIALTNTTLTAEEALEIGLITRVVADERLEQEGLGLARELAAGPTRALAETKRLIWDGIGRSVEECLPDESRTVSALSGTEDAREGLAAVIERRAPQYKGR